ncbi:MAG: peptide deformylase [Culicoidibacterales bacterium]
MLTMIDIIDDRNPHLREKSTELTFPLTDEQKNIAEEMLTYLKNSQDDTLAEKYGLRPGVGLAAPQIDRLWRMIAIHTIDEQEKEHSFVLVNPKIVSHSEEKTYLADGEGCLSVNYDVDGITPRYARITVEAFNLAGEKLVLRFRDFMAIVLQHEIDHLDGVLFYDHINPKMEAMVRAKARAL